MRNFLNSFCFVKAILWKFTMKLAFKAVNSAIFVGSLQSSE